jgi:hypothetical protein
MHDAMIERDESEPGQLAAAANPLLHTTHAIAAPTAPELAGPYAASLQPPVPAVDAMPPRRPLLTSFLYGFQIAHLAFLHPKLIAHPKAHLADLLLS